MCGIFGVLAFDGEAHRASRFIERMAAVQVHRGPDDQGLFMGDGIALGMRRLSIIDPSGGVQPISNEDGTVWTVCNGEIYNFTDLRETLVRRGHVFRSGSDAEVIVHLYEEEGVDFLGRLRGMFALALWDAHRRRLILARDRLGKKPLYLRRETRRLLFASEVKAILEDPTVDRRLDPAALREYLALGYVPAPFTMFEGIEKILPGHVVVIDQGHVSTRKYWDVTLGAFEKRSEADWAECIRDKFLESVRLRLVSDVPLGAFLSGGLDSSAIVAAMTRLTGRPVKTYSIGFAGKDAYYNELPHARAVANWLQADHHEVIVKPDIGDLLPRLIWHMDEPIADSALVTTYLVAALARKDVIVALSGVGGDELFGGYRRYLGRALVRYFHLLPRVLRTSIQALLAALPQDRHSFLHNHIRYATAFVKSSGLPPDLRYMSYITLFNPEIRAELMAAHGAEEIPASASRIVRDYFQAAQNADELDQLIYVDLKTSLPDDLLSLTDKMTMAVSLECRTPFLDHELVELSLRMPPSMKMRGLTLKYMLRKAVAPWLPPRILRRSKRGFGAPIGAWLRQELAPLVSETLSESAVRRRGLFHWPTVRALLESHQSKRMDATDHLQALINLELWCRVFLDGSRPGTSLLTSVAAEK